MTYVQLRNLVVRGLRAARKVYRSADTSGEVLERIMDRLITRKTLITPNQLDPLLSRWQTYRAKVLALEKALADAVNIAKVS